MIRETNNILLKKDEVGMSKPSTRYLPQFGHSYGLPGIKDSEGVGKCKFSIISIQIYLRLYFYLYLKLFEFKIKYILKFPILFINNNLFLQ